jgi:hypothetical protein
LVIFDSTSIQLKEKPLSITLTISQLKKVGEAINQTEIESIQVARGLRQTATLSSLASKVAHSPAT